MYSHGNKSSKSCPWICCKADISWFGKYICVLPLRKKRVEEHESKYHLWELPHKSPILRVTDCHKSGRWIKSAMMMRIWRLKVQQPGFSKNTCKSRSMRPYLTGLGMPGFVAGTGNMATENMRMAWDGAGLYLEAFLNLFHYARVTFGQVPLCWSCISDKPVWNRGIWIQDDFQICSTFFLSRGTSCLWLRFSDPPETVDLLVFCSPKGSENPLVTTCSIKTRSP